MALRLTAAPAAEPVSLAQAKGHLRVDYDDDDDMISMLITAARVLAENICRRAFVTQSWDLFLDDFPRAHARGEIVGFVPFEELPRAWGNDRTFSVRVRGNRISLPFPRLQQVVGITYTDPTGVVQTSAQGAYVVDDASEPGAIVPAPGTCWPATQCVVNAVKISFTAGYGDADAVPAPIKSWILMQVGALYENREAIVVGQRITSVDLPFVDRLLDAFIIWSYA